MGDEGGNSLEKVHGIIRLLKDTEKVVTKRDGGGGEHRH